MSNRLIPFEMTDNKFLKFSEFDKSKGGTLVFQKNQDKNINTITASPFEFAVSGEVGSDISFTIVDHKKELKCLVDDVKLGIAYAKKNKKIYGISGGKKYTIAQNRAEKHLTHTDFHGTGLKPLRKGEWSCDITGNKGNKAKDQSDLIKMIDTLTNNLKTLGNKKANKSYAKNLNQRIEKLEKKIDSLGSGSSGTDTITGLEPRIKNLENAVKLDQKHPSSSGSNNTIDYYLNRDREDILSLFDQIDYYGTSISRIQRSISPTTDWSQDSNIDLMATINALTARVDALEG